MLDSVGIGELPDAALYGDEGSNTLGNIARQRPAARSRDCARSGLGRRRAHSGGRDARSLRRLAPSDAWPKRRPGKDSVTGHWEMMGIVLDRPFPTFPDGFPADVIAEFERRIGRGTLGNVVASGTEIIDELGAEHVRTGKPIVYTSADSVFQIAAHEDVIPIAELYRICEIAFELVGRGMGVGRVIARPFVGAPGAFTRTANRHDYALEPIGETLLDRLTRARHSGRRRSARSNDLFAGRGIARAVPTTSDDDGMDARARRDDATTPAGLIFANLVDFDTRLRPSQRRRRLCRQPRAVRRAARRACCARCATTTCWSSPPITATIRRRRAPITPASTCRCW